MTVILLALLGGAASAQDVYNASFEIDEGGGEVWQNSVGNDNRCDQRSGDNSNIPDGDEVMEVGDDAYCRSNAFLMTTQEMTFWAAGKDNDDQLAEVAVFPSSGGADLALWGPVFLDRDSKDSGFDQYHLDTTPACATSSRIEARNLSGEDGANGNESWVIDHFQFDYTQPCPEYVDGDMDGQCEYGTDQGGLGNCSEPGDHQSATIVDCDDTDHTVYDGAPELCDGKDNDCDGSTDEGVTLTFYEDHDGDGQGSAVEIQACVASPGVVANSDDCDDSDPDVYLGAPVVLLDGIDNDCSGGVDECYVDSDGDGFGDSVGYVDSPNLSCTDTGEADNPDDCDDSTGLINPDADETTCNGDDDDCNGSTLDQPNADGDAFNLCHGDCNDDNPLVYPGAPIVVGDGEDNDCSGVGIDECYLDDDGDGYGDASNFIDTLDADCNDGDEADDPEDCDDGRFETNPGAPEVTCNSEDDDCDPVTLDAPNVDGDAYTVCENDCNDTDPHINPGATSVVGDGVDNNCSGGADECYRDIDGDDYGTSTIIDSSDLDCNDNNEAPVSGDCNDSLSSVNPGETEVTCNNRNDDCDGGTPDEPDADNDGFDICGGNADCDDTDPEVRPGAPELCDGIDNDCSGAPAANEADGDGDGVRVCEGDCRDNDSAISPLLAEVPCDGKDNDCSTGGTPDASEVDNDGDGFAECDVQSDCDDDDPGVNPGAGEVCNDIDDDCVGGVDDGLTFSDYFPDVDNDGFGDEAASPDSSCRPVDGFVTDNTDCHDTVSTTYPGATEQCDNVDNDCDGLVDDETTTQTYYEDADGDGFGDPMGNTLSDCSAPVGFVDNPDDCNDDDADISPDADELCDAVDRDCNGDPVGGLPQVAYYEDFDGDGFGDLNDTNPELSCAPVLGKVADNTDCDDGSVLVAPGKPELCDGEDNDCNGVIDNGLLFRDYREDLDGDGFGAGVTVSACSDYLDWVISEIDCDDDEVTTNPDADEICDGVDNDCDNAIDEDLPPVEWYADLDGDGFGAGTVTVDCGLPATGASELSTDCNDSDAFVNPTAAEQCDTIDNNCDGLVDNGVVEVNWYLDFDGDGYGDDTITPELNCAAPGADYVEQGGDCNDANSLINPAVAETCAPGDEDCDGLVDIDDPEVDAPDWYQDNDSDGYGSNVTIADCVQPSGYVDQGGDCDDATAGVRPGALEVCPDGVDNDCDGFVDADDTDYVEDAITFWADTDGDGIGTPAGGATVCPGPDLPAFFVLPSAVPDCDDNDGNTFPGAPEVCDSVDNNCNGVVDDDLDPSEYQTYYPDVDGDGFGDDDAPFDYCNPDYAVADGYIETGGDCDDEDAAVNPLAEELCGDGTDQDCDGTDPQPFDQWPDDDGDGYGDADATAESSCETLADHVTEATDCDDTTDLVNPGMTEVCNELDDDCDPATPEPYNTYYRDVDLDGVGVEDEMEEACEPPDVDWAVEFGDCAPDDAQRTNCVVDAKDAGCGCSAVDPRTSTRWLLRR